MLTVLTWDRQAACNEVTYIHVAPENIILQFLKLGMSQYHNNTATTNQLAAIRKNCCETLAEFWEKMSVVSWRIFPFLCRLFRRGHPYCLVLSGYFIELTKSFVTFRGDILSRDTVCLIRHSSHNDTDMLLLNDFILNQINIEGSLSSFLHLKILLFQLVLKLFYFSPGH